METELPRTVGLRIEEALACFRQWRGVDPGEAAPKVVRVLGSQSNNFSVLVANSHQFVLRVNRADHGLNDLDANAESSALERAAAAGIAPTLRYFDPQRGVMACDYLVPDRAAPTVQQLAVLLAGIHALRPIPHRLSLSSRIRHYVRATGRTEGAEPNLSEKALAHSEIDVTAASEAALELEALDSETVLCHNDLLPQNCIVSGGRLWAVDWEYAAMGNRWFDIAACSVGHNLQSRAERDLLRSYLDRDPNARERRLLELARRVYRGIEGLWHACNDVRE